MVTTVTTTTTTLVTAGAPASLSLIAILTLIALLTLKQIASGLADPRSRRLSRVLNVAIVPLTIVFVISLLVRIVDVLSS